MPTVHLVSNAHLDPVWSWPWDEGLVEAIATFRIAVHQLDQFPEYIFVRGESLLYEWIEEHDPALFVKVRELVQAGRWIIVGGWYLQPDCNIPGGESFVRQALIGKAYFREKFGVEPIVAYNVDSFGHTSGLPQIMCKSGSRYYVHFRPDAQEKDLPEVYRWQGVDGSEIITSRPLLAGYCTEPGTGPEKVRKGVQRARETGKDVILFWGVGDHGGGATRTELEEIRRLIQDTPDVEIEHSHPQRYFDAITGAGENFPVIADELQRSFSGCYTSAASIKRAHRKAEGMLAQAERLAAMASFQIGRPYPKAELEACWKDLLFNEFHDSLAGTTAKAPLQDILDIFGRCHQAARKIRLGAALAIAAGSPQPTDAIPIHVFNPHAFPYKGPVEADFMLDYRPLNWTGERIPVEVSGPDGSTVRSQDGISTFVFPLDWRKKLYFWAEVPPLSSACFLVRRVAKAQESEFVVRETPQALDIETGQLSIRFERENGGMVSLEERAKPGNYLRNPGIQALVMADPGDTWGTGVSAYRNLAGQFTPARPETIARLTGKPATSSQESPLSIVEQGALRIVVDSILEFRASTLIARYIFYPDSAHFDLLLKLNWNEPNHFLKLSIPTAITSRTVRCEIPYGAIQRPADGTEYPTQRWILLENAQKGLGVINTGQYGYDAMDGELRLSLVRSPQYAALTDGGKIAQLERTPDFMDIGPHEIQLAFVVGAQPDILAETIRIAQQTNIPAMVLPYFQAAETRSDLRQAPGPLLSIEPSSVVLAALKQAEDGKGLIIRLHESIGSPTEATLTLPDSSSVPISMNAFEIKTIRLYNGSIQPCDLLERTI